MIPVRIPVPPYAWRIPCPQCPLKFWTVKGYQGHYAVVHVLGLRHGQHPGLTA